MKYFIVADVHGYYDELMQALNNAGFDPKNTDHTFVSLGDLLDRGRQPVECLKFVNKLKRKILVMGNHEVLMDTLIHSGWPKSHDKHNGTVQTITDIYTYNNKEAIPIHDMCISLRRNKDWCKYYDSLVNYAEFGNYIGVHGWIPKVWDYDMHQYKSPEAFKEAWSDDWERSRWVNGMEEWYENYKLTDKTILCGHWHTSWGHRYLHKIGSEFGDDACFDPFIDEGIIALDACTALSRKVNCIVLEVN